MPKFNAESMSTEDVVGWAENLGIVVLEDRSVPFAVSLKYKDTRMILHTPLMSEYEKILAIGHELGHHVLGHVDSERELHFRPASLFSHYGMEKNASIIGHLCLMPTTGLFQLAKRGRLDAEELYRELQPWMDMEEGFAWEICMARINIFRDFIRVKELRRD
jgi:Zn-dependent peptidase ImmA (M78 family)